MVKAIEIVQADGSKVVCNPSYDAKKPKESEGDFLARVAAQVAPGLTWQIIEAPAEPSDEEVAGQLHNAGILRELVEIDRKKIRAITDRLLTGDKTRLDALETHAALLRGQLRKG